MMLLYILFTVYCLNFSITFLGESLISLFAFYFICIYANKIYFRLKYEALQLSISDWACTMRIYLIIKMWYILSIRRSHFKLYDFYNHCVTVKNVLLRFSGKLFFSQHRIRKFQITKEVIFELKRSQFKKRLLQYEARIQQVQNMLLATQ